MRTVGALLDGFVPVDITHLLQAGLLHWHWDHLNRATTLGLILLTWCSFNYGMDK